MATVIVKKGDTLSALAKKYGVTLAQMIALNPNKQSNPNLIYVGENLNIPGDDNTGDTAGTAPAVEPKQSNILSENTTHVFSPDENVLIKFTADPTKYDQTTDNSTVWLFDAANSKMVPFTSEAAFNAWSRENWDGSTIQDANNQGMIHIAPASLLLPGKAFEGVQMLGSAQGIQSDGKPPKTDTIDVQTSSYKYGQSKNQSAEDKAKLELFGSNGSGGLFELAKKDGLSAAAVDEVMNDPNALFSYINARAYGGYTVPDLLRDLKKREAIKKGDTSLVGTKVIDEGVKASEYYATTAGKLVLANPLLNLPATLASKPMSSWEYDINNMPKEAFETLTKPFDWQSEEGKKLMADVKTSYYDIMMQGLEATTAPEQAKAQYAYKQLQKTMADNYGIQLSDNATTAWGQLQQIESGMESRGLSGSGTEEAAVANYLGQVRKANARVRTAQATDEENKKMEYYLASATPEQIAKLTDQQKADWGLKPDAENSAYFDLANLKAKFPDLSEEKLQAYRDQFIDENGNFRSTLYKTMFANKLQLQKEKEDYQMGTVTYDKDGNITGGYGAIYNKALEEQKNRNWLNLNKDYYGDTSKLNADGTPVVADAAAADAKLASDQAAKDAAEAAKKTSSGSTTATSSTPTGLPKTTTSGFDPYAVAQKYGYTQDDFANDPGFYDYWSKQNESSLTAALKKRGDYATKSGSTTNNVAAAAAAKAASNLGSGTTTPPPAATTPAKTGYQGSSIVDYLNSVGKDSSQTARAALAKQYGITNYAYTSQQNTDLLKKLRGY